MGAGGGRAGHAIVAHAAPAIHVGHVAAVHAAPVPHHVGYAGPLNLNTHLVAHPNGAVVPADEPAVAARRAEHFAAGGGRAGHAIVAHAAPLAAVHAAPAIHAAPVAAVHGAHVAHAGYGPLNLNTHLVAHPNGAVVPADEPAVVA